MSFNVHNEIKAIPFTRHMTKKLTPHAFSFRPVGSRNSTLEQRKKLREMQDWDTDAAEM